MVTKTDFETIYQIWKTKLWPERKTEIETHSAMLISGEYELKNFNYPATFFIYKIDDKIAGCNSGHMCCDGTYRSRGLYVFPEFRKRGIGKELLLATIDQGKQENCEYVWSYPRYESWTTYQASGFKLTGDWHPTETGINAYCTCP